MAASAEEAAVALFGADLQVRVAEFSPDGRFALLIVDCDSPPIGLVVCAHEGRDWTARLGTGKPGPGEIGGWCWTHDAADGVKLGVAFKWDPPTARWNCSPG